MSSNEPAFSSLAALERQMWFIKRDASLARINRAQCALLACRLCTILETLRHLPDPLPSPQLFSVFNSADMLIQQMGGGRWKHVLLRHFTCRKVFAALFERMGRVWRLHQTILWEVELKAAVGNDEIDNASLCVQLLQSGEKLPFSFCMFEEGKSFSSDDAPTFTEKQLINLFRRRQLSGWKISSNDLTPPDVGTVITPITSLKPHFVFNVFCGYRYDNTPVVLHTLEGSERRTVITPDTITAFVQDMVSRSRWCHPNIVPFLGAFTEKASYCNSSAPYADTSAPALTLGFITEDATRFTAFCCEDENGVGASSAGAYVRLRAAHNKSDVTHCSLYDALFVRRQRFTIKEAIGITLQVADALQYILMDKMDVPDEVVTAWTTVTPSNIFFGFISAETSRLTSTRAGNGPSVFAEAEESPLSRDQGSVHSSGKGLPQSLSLNENANDNTSHAHCAADKKKTSEDEQCVCLPFTGKFSVMYSPPVYIEGGPFSRWRPHPHAANPASYALTQLFIAMISNEPPYRTFVSQKELAIRVFDVVGDADGCGGGRRASTNGLSHVKLGIPIGTAIPAFLPQELRQLCARGLFLRRGVKGCEPAGIGLHDFIEKMRALYDTTMDVFCHVSLATSQRHLMLSPDESNARVSLCTEPCFTVEMTSLTTPLSDYGEISTGIY